MTYYTIKFNVNLESVCYNNGLAVFMKDCTNMIKWDLDVKLNRAESAGFWVSIELNDEDVYHLPIREALAYILNHGKYTFPKADYSLSFLRQDIKVHYGQLEYNSDGERKFY